MTRFTSTGTSRRIGQWGCYASSGFTRLNAEPQRSRAKKRFSLEMPQRETLVYRSAAFVRFRLQPLCRLRDHGHRSPPSAFRLHPRMKVRRAEWRMGPQKSRAKPQQRPTHMQIERTYIMYTCSEFWVPPTELCCATSLMSITSQVRLSGFGLFLKFLLLAVSSQLLG